MSPALLLLTLMQPAAPPDIPRVVPPGWIGFRRVLGHIELDGTLGGRPVRVVLDTGAGANVMDTELAEKFGLAKGSDIPVGGSGGAVNRGWALRGVTLDFGPGGRMNEEIGYAVPLKPLAAFTGRPLQVILGVSFFRKYTVEIDYPRGLLRISRPSLFERPKGAIETPFKLVAGHPHIRARIQDAAFGTQEVTAMVDTGATGALTLTGRFARANGLLEKLAAQPTVPIGAGVGGSTQGKRTRIASLSFAGRTFTYPTTTVVETEGGATGARATYDVLVGAEILSRYRLICDYPRQRLLWVPGPEIGQRFAGEGVGIRWVAAGPAFERIEVSAIDEGSPADGKNVRPRDRLIAINRRSVRERRLWQVREQFQDLRGPITLTLERDFKRFDVRLESRELWPVLSR